MKLRILVGTILFLIGSAVLLYLRFGLPFDYQVEREFLETHPGANVESIELIFDWEPKRMYSYLVKYREPHSEAILSEEFTVRQTSSFGWEWCHDYTERKCE